MKKLFFSAVATLALAFSLTSCSDNGPKSAAKKFLDAYAHMEYATAKEVSTEATKKQLSDLENAMGMIGGIDKKSKDEAQKVSVDVKEPKMTNDSMATVEYTMSNEPGVTKTLNMVKQNGKWLAEWSKMPDLGNMGDGAMPADPSMDPNGAPMSDTSLAPPADPSMDPSMTPATPAAGDTGAAR